MIISSIYSNSLKKICGRFPSFASLWTLFLVCIFPTHLLSYVVYLQRLPALLVRFSVGEALSVLAYMQFFVMLETIALFTLLILTAILTPRSWFLDNFRLMGTILVSVLSIWTLFFHLQRELLSNMHLNIPQYFIVIFFWICTLPMAILGLSRLMKQSEFFRQILDSFIDRSSVVSSVYLGVDLIWMCIIVFRIIRPNQ